MIESQKVRIDKYLWAVRIYKTRTLAAEACNGGKVKLNNESIKPSKNVEAGDLISLHKDMVHRKFKVLKILEKRLGAALINEYLEDLTDPSEIEKSKNIKQSAFYRQKGLGRPTKRERRLIDKLKNQ